MIMTFTVSSKAYTINDEVSSNSAYYQDIVINGNNHEPFYLYQSIDGLHNIRQLTRQSLSLSALVTNVGGNDVAIRFGIYRFYDPESELTLSRAVNLKEGINIIGASIDGMTIPEGATSGAAPRVEFRVYITEFTNSCHVQLHYVKAEIGKFITPNFCDNFLEKARIANV